MDVEIATRLINLNRQFYQTFAHQFSATRQRIQPGVQRVIENMPNQGKILDLGCGNGEFWLALTRRGFHGIYVGIDFSKEMIEIASRNCHINKESVTTKSPDENQAFFINVDLSTRHWHGQIPKISFDRIFAFALIHHLPGHDLHLRTLRRVRNLLSPGGLLVHSEWQFINNPRLRGRILDWKEIGLSKDLVDEGDYLLDWRHGGYGLRYVHLFSEEELSALAQESGFRISQTFHSDGKGGESSLYQIWETNSDRIG